MCWMALKKDGSSLLIRCPNSLDSAEYQATVLTPALSFIRGPGLLFQQDNAPPHVSRSTIRWFAAKKVRLLQDWPACSPDLNVVEHAWAWITSQLIGQTFPNADALWAAVQAAWAAVPPAFVHKLWDSIPRRIEAVRRAQGGATRY